MFAGKSIPIQLPAILNHIMKIMVLNPNTNPSGIWAEKTRGQWSEQVRGRLFTEEEPKQHMCIREEHDLTELKYEQGLFFL